ncbi:wall-associated receptor kinase-like 14 isoform X3 [Salvia splendens]|uniref:wall-associated receptor kinase-like 14 isoform X3 n=1 Tax=Salvia splendens TaxID=180675 RepID=UPI001C25B5E9|nr:wall-associated receptor kinase-like 14 isoform X3 [Salvia splendens]
MKLKSSNRILFHAASLVLCAAAAMAAAACNQTCGWRTVPFPFGFSSSCEIQLNCSPNGTALAADFPVLSISSDTILASLPAVCNRPVEALGRLFTRNYTPTFLNALLLQNCSGGPNSCFIPTTEVRANFELLDCGGHANDSIHCYSQADNSGLFMDYGKLRRSGCTSLFSAISIESLDMSNLSVSLDVRIVRLGWWRLGRCGCSDHAKCEAVSPPGNGEASAYRCRCLDGFVGDGFRDGMGCRRDQECNLSKYLSGECGGATRILVLIGVTVTAAAAITLRFVVKLSKVRSRSRRHRSLKLKETASITIPIYPYKEMEKATNFFSDKKMLGTGAYGTVYSGKLSNDKWVAIKRLKQRDHGQGDIQHVINEIKLLSSVKHPNLVQLLGCSIEREDILVYEFMPNGTLSQHLQGEKAGGLPWPVRLNIAAETARALSYLHHTLQPPIYHRDVKTSNILLDYNLSAKVADFGLSRLGMSEEASHVSTAPQGTPGYVDPQYHQHFHLSDKSDVYSFGVVLVEIMTAMRVVDFSRPPGEINLAALAVDRIGRGCLEEIVDPFILKSGGGEGTLWSVNKVGELAFRCLAFDRDLRPTMMDVLDELEQIAAAGSKSSSNLMVNGSLCKVSSSKKSLKMQMDLSPIASVSDETPPSSNS